MAICINLMADSADDKLKFSYFFLKTGFDIPCKLSPLETLCMKCQNLFSGKNKKNISNVVCCNFYPACLSIKQMKNNENWIF